QITGSDVWRDPVAVKAIIGVLPEGLRLFERLSGRELLSYLGRLRGLPRAEVDSRADELLTVLDLASAGRTLVVDYSTGMRKKIALAAALLHNPRALFLDEPFEGVDPVAGQPIGGVLDAYTRSGSTVIFSSHVMELVQSLCNWVAVMSQGQIMACGTLEQIRGGRAFDHPAGLQRAGAAGWQAAGRRHRRRALHGRLRRLAAAADADVRHRRDARPCPAGAAAAAAGGNDARSAGRRAHRDRAGRDLWRAAGRGGSGGD